MFCNAEVVHMKNYDVDNWSTRQSAKRHHFGGEQLVSRHMATPRSTLDALGTRTPAKHNKSFPRLENFHHPPCASSTTRLTHAMHWHLATFVGSKTTVSAHMHGPHQTWQTNTYEHTHTCLTMNKIRAGHGTSIRQPAPSPPTPQSPLSPTPDPNSHAPPQPPPHQPDFDVTAIRAAPVADHLPGALPSRNHRSPPSTDESFLLGGSLRRQTAVTAASVAVATAVVVIAAGGRLGPRDSPQAGGGNRGRRRARRRR